MLCSDALRDFSGRKCSEVEHLFKTVLKLGVAEENVILEDSLSRANMERV